MTNSADAINEASVDSVPKISSPPDTVVELMAGVYTSTGLASVAVVREMTGEDEEALSSLSAKQTLSYSDYLSALLKRTVVSLGDTDVKKTPEIVDDLILADRDILFLAVVKATYGPTRTFSVTCPHCNQDSDIFVDMDTEFPIQGTKEQARSAIPVTLKNGQEVTLRLPTSADAKFVSKKGKTTAEQNTLMLSRCVTLAAPVADMEHWARSLGIADRNTLISVLFDLKLGPKVGEVNGPCPSCGETLTTALDWASLLFG